MNDMDWRAIAAIIAGLNIIMLALNGYVTMRVQLAISEMERKRAEDRASDERAIKAWAEERFAFKSQIRHQQHGD